MRTSDIAALTTIDPTETSFMTYRAKRGQPRQPAITFAKLDGISPLLCASIVKAEDRYFFGHSGFDIGHITRTVLLAVRHGEPVRGVSSITQQLARNLFLTPERSYRRKLKEACITVLLERNLSKMRILELYMNVIEWGRGIWGCRQAALHYFGKMPESLNLFESSFLAAVIPAPLRPIGDWYPQSGRKLQIRVLFQLLLAGLITIEMLADALARTQMMTELISQKGTPNLAAAIFPDPKNVQAFKNFLELADKELQCAANRPVPRDEMFATRFGLETELRTYRKAEALFSKNAFRAFLEALASGDCSQLIHAFNNQQAVAPC